MSESTGIVYNDEMDDFSMPNTAGDNALVSSPSNYIQPAKCPMSSMTPMILLDDNNDVSLVVGAAGEFKNVYYYYIAQQQHRDIAIIHRRYSYYDFTHSLPC
jgi:gamma-glutamyltranspeptidase